MPGTQDMDPKFLEQLFLSIFNEKSEIYFFFANIEKKRPFVFFWGKSKHTRAGISRKTTDEYPEISHMRPIQARKLKLKIDKFPDPGQIDHFLRVPKRNWEFFTHSCMLFCAEECL